MDERGHDRLRYREVEVRGILNTVPGRDDWFGLSYNLNLYRGCEHQCIYCDTRSNCYQIENFNEEVLIKVNALELLEKALPRKRRIGLIGFGSMNDPYTYAEEHYNLTGKALQLAAKYRFPVHIITKSDMVLKDMDTLIRINRIKARVSFYITTTDDALARKLEPGAPSPTRRLRALRQLSTCGIETGVVMMPVLPFLEDTPENILSIVNRAADNGANYIIPAFGMTIRDGQREYFYKKLDQLFPGMRQRYQRAFGYSYHCPAYDADQLAEKFYARCEVLGIATHVSPYPPEPNVEQMALF